MGIIKFFKDIRESYKIKAKIEEAFKSQPENIERTIKKAEEFNQKNQPSMFGGFISTKFYKKKFLLQNYPMYLYDYNY